jgi:drug/metabolite transporter (DMT)-like permease
MNVLLLLMVVIWGTNYSVAKRAFDEIPPQAFNAVRVTVASVVFLAVIHWAGRQTRRSTVGLSRVFYTPERLTLRDRVDLCWVGFVGHFLYQSFFIGGLSRTSASNAALIIGTTPVLVAVFSSALGLERISLVHWIGVAASVIGVYFVVASGGHSEANSTQGDLMVVVAVVCWAIYTLGSGRLMARHSPLYVTGMTMAYGGLPYAAVMSPNVWRVSWTHVSPWAMAAVVLSALLALCLSYLIWYAAVQRIGAARTAMYSNLVPIAAMAVAVIWLHEPLSRIKLLGAAGVLTGVFLTRLGRTTAATPPEE